MSVMGFSLLARSLRSFKGRTKLDLVPFFLLFVAAAFMSQALLSGGMVMAGDLVFYWYPWNSLAPSHLAGPSNLILTDPVLLFHPWQLFATRSLSHSEVPLWNPYVGGGAPFVGNDQSHVFFPFNVLYYLLPFPAASTLALILTLFFAGFFMYQFAKLIGVGRLGGTVSAISFMFSGTMVLWLQFPLALAAMLTPAVFFACERLVLLPRMRNAAVLAIAIGLQLLAGQPEISALCLGAMVLYSLYRVSTHARHSHGVFRVILYLSLGMVLGIALAAVQVLPFYEYLRLSHAYATRVDVNWYWLRPEFVLTNLVPNLFGNPVTHNYWHPQWNYNEINGAYVGPIPLMLALMAWLNRTHRPRTWFFYGLSLLSFGVVYRVPCLYEVVRAIPLFGGMNLLRLLFVAAFSLSVLAGIGADGLSQGSIRPRAAVILPLGLVLAGYVGLLALMIAPGSPYLSISVAIAKLPAGMFSSLARYEALNVLWFTFLAAIGGVAFYFHTQHGGSRRVRASVQGMLLIVILIGSFSFGFYQNPVVPTSLVYPTYPVTPAVEFLRNDSAVYRITSVGCCVLPPYSGMMYGIQDSRMTYGDGLTPETYSQFERAALGAMPDNVSSWNLEMLSLANVKYILTPPSSCESLQSLMPRVYHGSDADIYLNGNAMPRAFIVFDILAVSDDQEALSALQRIDVRKTAIIAEPLGMAEVGRESKAEATIREYTDTMIAIDTQSGENAFLVLTDVYFPGWTAFVDGHPTNIFRADYTFRGVVVPPGFHVVRFTYEPASFSLGLATSIVSVFVTIVMLSTRLTKKIGSTARRRCEFESDPEGTCDCHFSVVPAIFREPA